MRYFLMFFLVMALSFPALADEAPDFNTDIRPILSDRCFACHGPDEKHRQGGFRLDQKESAFGEADSGAMPIVPGDLDASELVARITSGDEFTQMPPPDSNKELTAEEIAKLKAWVKAGAKWEEHWAFVPPVQAPLPEVNQPDWPRNEIDHFILARLEREGLSPTERAAKETLIRRVTLDLTGLPPTLAEIDAFLADESPGAYERVVDRLLKSPHYGEHMARYWLDGARYGDTHGLHLDNFREMWPYRDWVVRAFNDNKPYDLFTIEQLAGDLLPDATLDQKVATGFNRCHVTTSEGGSIAQEVFTRNVVDRVVTTGTVFMGLTLECTRCHDHKYDPLTQRDFYSLFAFFNSLEANPLDGNKSEHAPVMKVLPAEVQQQLVDVKQQIAAQQQAIETHRAEAAAGEGYQAWLANAGKEKSAAANEPEGLILHFPLDEAGGDTATSAVDSAHSAKVNGKTQWAEGKHGGAFDFDGGTFLAAGPLAGFERDQPFSYGAWLKPRNNGGGAVLAKMNDGNNFRGYDMYIAQNKVAVHIIHQWSGNAVKVTTKAAMPADQWTHVFATYDGSSKAAGVKIYFNGEEQPFDVNVDALTGTIKTTAGLRLGSRTPGSVYNGLADDIRIYNRELNAAEVQALAGSDPIGPILATPEADRTEEQKGQLVAYYLSQFDKPFAEMQNQLAAFQKQQTDLEAQAGTTLVWKETANPREAHILNRGEYDQPTDKVSRATPMVLPPMPEDLPRDRLGLAKWLTDEKHPLTSRVAVNRFWQQVFGTGLVKTSEDFGSQGDPPSHPQLLDWLAVQFTKDGWDVKATMRRMVTSATYMQSSKVTPELVRRDPRNRLLARGPRHRLDAETIRDQALAASGLLSRKLGGPSVKPPQPDGLWFAVGYSGSNTVRFKGDTGHDKVHRRTLYTFIKRTAPPPQMSTFDAPSREACTVRRERTNTPMQALLLMNDPQYVEAARALGERAMKEGGDSAEKRADTMFRLLMARHATDEEQKVIVGAYQDHLTYYQAETDAAKKLIAVGQSTADPKLDTSQLAAWTMVANLLLNLDEVVTKN